MGGFFEGLYWESGVLDFFSKKENDINLYTSSIGSLRGVFYSKYGSNFFLRLKSFLAEKDNPLNEIIKSSELYHSRYAQTTALIKLGRGKLSLYDSNTLKKFLIDYFEDETIGSLGDNIHFEVLELKSREIITLNKNIKIVDMLMMELAFPPYYGYYEFEGGYFIPSSFLSFIPQKFPKDSMVIAFDPSLRYPYPKNTVEILLKTSYSRTLKNYRIITENIRTIEPKKTPNSYFNMSAFFDGQNDAKEFMEVEL